MRRLHAQRSDEVERDCQHEQEHHEQRETVVRLHCGRSRYARCASTSRCANGLKSSTADWMNSATFGYGRPDERATLMATLILT
jgi:hypothetical protein